MRIVQTLVFGLVTGSFLVTATLGFALVSRVEKFLNIAHAEVMSMAAFLTYYLQVRRGWPLLLAALLSIAAAAVVAVAIHRSFFAPVRRSGPVVLLITSVGVVFLLHGLIEALVRPGVYTYELPSVSPLRLGNVRIQLVDLITVGLAAASVFALHLFLTRTEMGLLIRALADDEELAAARGIDLRRARGYVWLMAGGLAGVAGVLLGLRGALNTDIAFGQILLILSVSILAGLGSIYGVVVAGMALGLAMDLSTLFLPGGYRGAVAFVVVILVLILRPEGLSGSRWARRVA